MTSTHTQSMISAAREFSDSLFQSARSDVAVKLQAVDEACRSIIESGGTVSIKSVRGWVSTNRGISIAASTLMNRRLDPQTGENNYSPARLIINKYIECQRHSGGLKTKKEEQKFGSFALSEAEMKEIEDHTVRYKVQLIVGRMRNLETQLNQLRTINKLPSLPPAALSESYLISSEGLDTIEEPDRNLSLSEDELEALSDFLELKSMRRRKAEFDENGTLRITHPASPKTTVKAISKPFLETSLRKILKSYHGKER